MVSWIVLLLFLIFAMASLLPRTRTQTNEVWILMFFLGLLVAYGPSDCVYVEKSEVARVSWLDMAVSCFCKNSYIKIRKQTLLTR